MTDTHKKAIQRYKFYYDPMGDCRCDMEEDSRGTYYACEEVDPVIDSLLKEIEQKDVVIEAAKAIHSDPMSDYKKSLHDALTKALEQLNKNEPG